MHRSVGAQIGDGHGLTDLREYTPRRGYTFLLGLASRPTIRAGAPDLSDARLLTNQTLEVVMKHVIHGLMGCLLLCIAACAVAQSVPKNASGGKLKPNAIAANPNIKPSKTSDRMPDKNIEPLYVGPCNSAYACADGSVILCGPGSRPYEDASACYCWADPVCKQ